jgi:hypothetical protein
LRSITIILLLSVFFISCKNKNSLPAGILDREKMQTVLWDVIRAQSFTENFIKKDSTKNLILENAKLQQEIFAINHVTKDEFYTSYDYYGKHTELMATLLDSLEASTNREAAISNNKMPPKPKNLPKVLPNLLNNKRRDSLLIKKKQ